MGRKIFVSYKYHDSDVKCLPNQWYSEVHDYVDYIQNNILSPNDVYKGEKSDEDLSHLSDSSIESHLKDKIWDSSVTIVLISPNMRVHYIPEKEQWIPWEISYSLRETTRNDRTSRRNAILAVVLPDKSGSTDYYNYMYHFNILKKNIDAGYIHICFWEDFKRYPNYNIDYAIKLKEKTPSYKLIINI